MKKRALGGTGISVSEIAFGGVEIGMPYGIGVEHKEDMLSEADAIHLLHTAVEKGINFFDTARMYGDSERIMGNAFEGMRNRIVLATKCRHFRDKEGKMPESKQLESFIETSLAESLALLKTDYVDVFLLHQADVEILGNEVIAKTFQRLKAEGRIRATGASTYSTAETRLAMDTGAWDVIQLPFNLMDQSHGVFFEEAEEKGIGIVVRSVLMKGLLSNRRGAMHPALVQVESHIRQLEALFSKKSDDMPGFATQFALALPGVSSVLVGIDKMEYLKSALATVAGDVPDQDIIRRAQEMAYPDPAFLNMGHWSRMGWLK